MANRQTPFTRLAITHSLLAACDVALVVALANTFFALDADAARSKVLLYLLVSLAPFAVVAPLIGPMVDRAAGGRRMIIQLTAIGRAVCYVLLALTFDTVLIFPLAFVVLVLQKTYGVSKSALVPSLVRGDDELVEANSKLGLLSGLCGGVAAAPLGVFSLISPRVPLVIGAGGFIVASLLASKLPGDVVAAAPVDLAERDELRQPRLLLAAFCLALIRASLGLLFFHIYFWIRDEHFPAYWLALAIATVSSGILVGNAIAPVLRRVLSEEIMLLGSLVAIAVAGVVAAVLNSIGGAVALSAVVNIGAAVGRMAFESLVQRDAPDANQGRAFAAFETRFQLSWALAGVPPTLFALPGWLGFLLVGLLGAFGAVSYVLGGPKMVLLRVRAGRPTSREPRTRRAWAMRPADQPAPPADFPPPDPRHRQ